MEFSIPQSRWLRILYHWYSFRVMPGFGRLITGEDAPFTYLAESIRTFPPPEKVREMLISAGFVRVTIQPLSNGLVTVYSAIKQELPCHTPSQGATSRDARNAAAPSVKAVNQLL